MICCHSNITHIGYFGSYARGDWGVGSDIDLVVILRDADEPFEHRAMKLDTSPLPVPADVLVYTEGEWETLKQRESFGNVVREVIWIR
jgi:predicted nucleotidyltransferase